MSENGGERSSLSLTESLPALNVDVIISCYAMIIILTTQNLEHMAKVGPGLGLVMVGYSDVNGLDENGYPTISNPFTST